MEFVVLGQKIFFPTDLWRVDLVRVVEKDGTVDFEMELVNF